MAGMEYPCWFVTLTRGHCLDLDLRRNAWHMLLTRLGKQWPDVEAWTTYEYGPKRRGVHLHAIVKRAPGLTPEWVDHIMALLGDGTEAHLEPTYENSEHLARYLTKQLGDLEYFRQWPRYVRPISMTHGWCPDWVPDRPSSAAARRPSLRKNSARLQAPRADAGDNGTPNDDMDEPE
jgi:hypothetical protein